MNLIHKMQPTRQHLGGDHSSNEINLNSVCATANGLLRIQDILSRPRPGGEMIGPHGHLHHQHPGHPLMGHPGIPGIGSIHSFAALNMKTSPISPPIGPDQSPPATPPMMGLHSPDMNMKSSGKNNKDKDRDDMMNGKHSEKGKL